MTDVHNLPEIAEEMLGGLTAGQDLKNRIQKAAAGGQAIPEAGRRRGFRFVPVFAGCCALALAVGVGVWALPSREKAPPQIRQNANDVFDSLPAGQSTDQPAVKGLLDLPQGSVNLSSGSGVPSYRSIWAPQNGGNFPLIGVGGQYYRLLREPGSVSSSLLGGSLGEVAEYTDEPSLSNTDSILSNTVAQGETVYAVSGMDGAMVAAKVEGTMRVFQRVTYAGSATLGSEDLSDTLGISGHVVSIELSGVGSVTDKDTAQSLAATLLDNAAYKSASASGGKQSLLIKLDNGLTVQMLVKNGTLSACGSWTCPEFFEAFEEAVQ